MFTHMESIRNALHVAHGNTYQLDTYRVTETGEHRVYISKHGEGLDVLSTGGKSTDVEEILIQAAKDQIDRNEEENY
jgi:hypothetical protein